MKARVPKGVGGGSPNMNSMIKQAQKMQEDMSRVQAELEEREYTATAGGGMVEVTVTGKHEIKGIKMNPEVVDPEEVEMLEDMIIAALNEAMRIVDETSEEAMSQVTGGLNIPGF